MSVLRRDQCAGALLCKIAHDCSTLNFGICFQIESPKRHRLSTYSSLFMECSSRTNSTCTMARISKNTSRMTFSLKRSWWNFCLHGDCGDYPVSLDLGSHKKTPFLVSSYNSAEY
ncbi:hypothetical protein TNCV_1058331 [Trichonephila clavipes]|nr:hypothetical protein TNCV_1058331 [Trichonephila clavipes]